MGDDLLKRLRDNGHSLTQRERSQAAARIEALERELAEAREMIKAHEEAAADSRRLAREIDVALHGEEGAAKQASLCDLVAPARELRAKIDALAAKKERKTFPILNGGGARFDYQLVADHGGQAKANHYQTVERLAERGGLSWQELHAVLHDRKFQKVDQNTAIIECRAIEARYLSALEPAAQDREALVAATLERAAEYLDDKAKAVWADRIRALATHAQTDALAAVRREARAEGMAAALEAIFGIEYDKKADAEGLLPPDRFQEGTSAAYEAVSALAAAEKEAGMTEAPREIFRFKGGTVLDGDIPDGSRLRQFGLDRYVRANAIPLSDALAIPEVAALVDAVDRLPAGTWEVWTSNSYRRITASHDGRHGPDGGVLHGTIQPSDGHPDLSMSADQLQAICEVVNGVRALRKIEEGRG